ncbi:MAG TPA: glycerophosphodiester phosphodiesterase family protein, partial [Xanthobacteraceae bacterium]|nr:glycerophosphodiester phosphodiesterase family protein [Xanthobacteraceae bacterium]
MSPLDWLTARPIAHRGLHDHAAGIVENTASAVAAAIDARYGIEVDLQISADGEAMVHHDDVLGRLTEGTGPLARMTATELKRVPFRATGDRMMALGDLCDLVAGRATLVLELKSRFDGDARIALRTVEVLRTYRGPVAAMSFDPDLVGVLGSQSPGLTRGIVAEARYDHAEWQGLSPTRKRALAHLGHVFRTRPQFVAYAVHDLPAAAPLIARALFGLPLLTWTV